MSLNKLALVRYKVIDSCLQNRRRKWTLENLVTACSEALYEYEGIKKGVSTRTVQLDIQNMRSEKLGYNAPIIVVDKCYYTYQDKDYSITNIPLTQQDLSTLDEVVQVLKQFKGFSYFQELTGMVNKLEDKIHRQQHKGRSYINFEKNDLLKGLEYIDPLHKAIMNQMVLEVSYQSFKARAAGRITFHPYLLKEYRNRWFALGVNTGGKGKTPQLLNLALDRILQISELPAETYCENNILDVDTYYDDAIGVTKNLGEKPCQVVLKIVHAHAPYVLTKPIHSSQQVLRPENDGLVISINVILNFELERELLGFGEVITVLGPRILVKRMKQRSAAMYWKYHKEETETGKE
jgi:predicted DNA-binding transcriptional regulator YafY